MQEVRLTTRERQYVVSQLSLWRQERNWSLRQTAKALGVDIAYLSRVERRQVKPSEGLIDKIIILVNKRNVLNKGG